MSNNRIIFPGSEATEQSMKNPTLPKVNPFEYPVIKCEIEGCDGDSFIPAIRFYEVPGVAVGSAESKVQVPIKAFICSKCGALSPMDREAIEAELSIIEEAKRNKK